MSLFKNLSLMTKVVFLLSLLVLFIWVIPTMVSYYTGIKSYETKAKVLTVNRDTLGLNEETESFDPYAFKTMLLNTFDRVEVEPLDDRTYKVRVEFQTKDIDKLNDLIERLSLRYWVKIVSPLTFEEKEKGHIEASIIIEKID